MVRLLASMAWCLLLVAGPAISITAAQSDPAHELIQLVNEFRAANGMSVLEINSALMVAAQRQADWQAVNYIHSHQGEGGTMPQDRANAAGYQGYARENVASGTLGYATPAWSVQGWASSYGHRMTMLLDSVHIGAGVAENTEETFFVLVIGSPSAFAPIPLPTQAEGAEAASGANTEANAAINADENAAQPAIVVPIVIAAPRDDGSVVHVVQEGQTAWAIAARYGVPLDDVRAINHLDTNAILHPGDEIIIRLGEGQPPPPIPTVSTTHIVEDGETLWTIAALHGLTLDELLALNDMTRETIIKPGDEVLIHAPEPTPMPTPTLSPTATVTPAATATAHTPTQTLTLTPAITASALAPTPIRTLTLTAPASPTLPTPTPVASNTVTPATPPPRTTNDTERTDQAVIGIGIVAAIVGLIAVFGGLIAMARSRRD